MKNGTQLDYPLELYQNKRIALITVALGALFFIFGRLPARNSSDDLWMLIATILGILFFVTGLSDLLSKKPTLVVSRESIRYRMGLGSFSYDWNEINDIFLYDFVHHSHHTGKGTRLYHLVLVPHEGKSKRITLSALEDKEQQLNIKERYYLIEQAFKQQSPKYQQISMTETDFAAEPDKFYRGLFVLRIIVIIAGFISLPFLL